MAITTLNQVLSGMQPMQVYNKATGATMVVGKPHSWWSLAGTPGAGSFDTTLNGVVLSQTSALVSGAIPFYDPPGGQNQYLARFQGSVQGGSGQLMLLDRLWHNGGFTITSTGAQSITSPTWPARDSAGTTNGAGVLLAMEISAAAGAASPTITVSYTNSAGMAGRTGTNVDPTSNSPAIGSFFRIGLQAGDYGVQSVQSVTLSVSWVSGTMNLVAYRTLGSIECPSQFSVNAIDAVTGGMPQLFNGTTPFCIMYPSAVTASGVFSSIITTQG